MNIRRLAAVALVAGSLAAGASPASATCYVAQINICDKPTDPYTRPITDPVVRTGLNLVLNGPAGPALGTAMETYADAYETALCLTADYWWC